MTSIVPFGLASALALAMCVEASAQPLRGLDERFAGMDRDRNGVITRDEWRGSDNSFRVHDWNNDGVLSGEEVRAGARRPDRPFDQNDYSNDRRLDFNDWTPRAFMNLDHNRDGRIARNEWHFSWETFRRADHNNDGVVTRGEFLNETGWIDDDRDDSFDGLDRDNNGYVERDEWHGALRTFQTLDANRDGRLSRLEVLGSAAPPSDVFQSLDVNRDGIVTMREWHWSRSSFTNLDVNRDGVLSRAELRRLPPTTSSSFAAASPPAAPISPPSAPTGDNRPAAPTGAYRAGQERGLSEGRAAGHEDRANGHGWDLEGQRELEQADAGYQASFGPRADYQAGYREAFRRGYREGFGE